MFIYSHNALLVLDNQRSLIGKQMQFTLALLLALLFDSHIYGQQVSNYHYTLNIKAWQWIMPASDGVSILLMGDTNIQGRHNPSQAFQHLMPTLKAADAKFLNLEGPFSPPSTDPLIPDIPFKEHWRHSEPRMVKALADAQIDAVGVANNVTYPWQVLQNSLKVLDSAGIGYAGGGNNYAEAHTPFIVEKKNVKIAFLQYTATFWPFNHAAQEDRPGVAALKVHTYYEPPKQVLDKPGQPPHIITIPDEKALAQLRKDIEQASKQADVVIASFHWGVSGNPNIVGYEQTLAHAAIDAGADLIMGHGTHLIQPIEVYREKPIFYGLGNSAFDWYRVTDKRNGLMARAVFVGENLRHVSFVPLTRDSENDPVLLDPSTGKGNELYEKIIELSAGFGTILKIEGKEVVVTIQ